jgi:phytoene dehydrogenase-like protein
VKLLNTVGHVIPEGRGYGEVMARRARELKDLTRWMCPSFTDDVVIAEYVKGPAEFEEANPAMVNGAWHGGDRGITFAGPQRPAPGWAAHRTPIPGLYQTGATTYPGGSVTGGPGRNAAIVMLEDLGRQLL